MEESWTSAICTELQPSSPMPSNILLSIKHVSLQRELGSGEKARLQWILPLNGKCQGRRNRIRQNLPGFLFHFCPFAFAKKFI